MFRGKLTLDDPVCHHSLHHGSSCLHLITSSGTMLRTEDRSFVEPRHLHQPCTFPIFSPPDKESADSSSWEPATEELLTPAIDTSQQTLGVEQSCQRNLSMLEAVPREGTKLS